MGLITQIAVDDRTMERLTEQAASHGRSLEEEAADILARNLNRLTGTAAREAFARVRAMTPQGVEQTDSLAIIREARDSR